MHTCNMVCFQCIYILHTVSTLYTVNPPTVWPFNIIHCGLELNYARLQYGVFSMYLHTVSTLYTVNPPTV